MKKTKSILFASITVIMALVLGFSVVGCKKKKQPTTPTDPVESSRKLNSITLDTSGAQLEFLTGTDYSSAGLKVTADFTVTMSDNTTKAETKDVALTDSDLFISSVEYKKNVVGTYHIYVYYDYGSDSEMTTYDVRVSDPRAGLDVQLKSGVADVIKVGTEGEMQGKADLSNAKDWIEVRQPNDFGKVDNTFPVLDASKYDVELYRAGVKVEDASKVGFGVYEIVASRTDEKERFLEGSALVYVEDKPVSIVLSEDSTETSQLVSLTDNISSGWEFDVTLASGAVATVPVDDVNITLSGVDTSIIGTNKKATVKFNQEGKAGGSASGEVTYTITAPTSGSTVTLNREYSYNALLATRLEVDGDAADTALKAAWFAGVNAFLKYVGSHKDNIINESNRFIVIRGDGFNFVVQGTGKLVIQVASTSDSNDSIFELKKGSTTIGQAQTIHGQSWTPLTWENLEPGTYTLASTHSSRGGRLNTLTLTDVISGS